MLMDEVKMVAILKEFDRIASGVERLGSSVRRMSSAVQDNRIGTNGWRLLTDETMYLFNDYHRRLIELKNEVEIHLDTSK